MGYTNIRTKYGNSMWENFRQIGQFQTRNHFLDRKAMSWAIFVAEIKPRNAGWFLVAPENISSRWCRHPDRGTPDFTWFYPFWDRWTSLEMLVKWLNEPLTRLCFLKQSRPLPVMNGVPEPNQYRGTRGNIMIDNGIYIYVCIYISIIYVYVHMCVHTYFKIYVCTHMLYINK